MFNEESNITLTSPSHTVIGGKEIFKNGGSYCDWLLSVWYGFCLFGMGKCSSK